MAVTKTLDIDWGQGRQPGHGEAAQPGVVLVMLGGVGICAAAPLGTGRSLELGRCVALGEATLDDSWMSRRHARVRLRGGVWEVQDLGSRNGTALDGVVLTQIERSATPRVVRAGTSLFCLVDDIRPFVDSPITLSDGIVIGPSTRTLFAEVGRASRFGRTLHIVGESGVGKELAARAFHDFGPRSEGRFIAVNCAAIPEGVAERLLFGARKGAYSGADANADGYVQAADGGTLFLDEVAELDPAVQAKLLRVLEMHEVMPLGASRPEKVDLQICSATHKDLRAEVSAGRLREDLYFRLNQPAVQVPPLRERLEEMPLLVEQALRGVSTQLKVHASLVEGCMLRHWPGNVRELIGEVRAAAHEALAEGAEQVEARHLRAEAGRPFEGGERPPSRAGSRRGSQPDQGEVSEALRASSGNVSQAARTLGLHRTQLRRLLSRFDLDPRSFAD